MILPLFMWSYLLAGLTTAGLYLAGSSRRVGWLLALACQALWLVYATGTHQYGFYFAAATHAAVYWRNWRVMRCDAIEEVTP